MQPNINVRSMSPQQPEEYGAQGSQTLKQNKRFPWLIVIIILIIIALAVVYILFGDRIMAKKNTNVQYRAVFLTNGQVYFGKLENPHKEYVTLTDIYYLQVNQDLQSGNQQQTNKEPQFSLVKLGNELHGPTDKMLINRSQILFYEDLKENSKVLQAITTYKMTGEDSSRSAPQQKEERKEERQERQTQPGPSQSQQQKVR